MSDNQLMQEANGKLKQIVLSTTEADKLKSEAELIAILDKNESLWDRFLPSKAKKVNRDEAIRQLKQLTNNRMDAVQLYHDTRMAIVREQANFAIRSTSTHLHAELTKFVTELFEKIHNDIKNTSKSTVLSLEAELAELHNTYKLEITRQAQERILMKQLNTHIETSERLIDGIKVALEKRAQVLIENK